MADTPAQVALDELGLGDIVETAKGAKFWGEIIAFDTDGTSPGCTVRAIDPGFEGTKHVYPLKQLRRRALSSLSGEAGDDGQGALVERLRKAADEMREEGQNGWPVTCDDAADRIEALTRENAALRADKERLERERDDARQDAERLLVSFVREHCDPVEGWAPLPDLEGIITQLDNATTITREFKKRAEAAERRLAEQGQAQAAGCDRCAGNGEIVTDWDRYRHPHDGDVGDEAVADCPDCFGVGTVPATPPSPEPDAELVEALTAAAYKLISDAHSLRLAERLEQSGWVWPDDGPDFIHGTIHQVVTVLRRHRKQGGV